jgi:hypothetical protein
MDTFITAIEHEGRQESFLKFFQVILKNKNEMLFENQLRVLNAFLPLKDLDEKTVKLLYAANTTHNNHV